ncbi:hypothetical protein C6501_10465 [Candidatus Poribacteria bacterium]|nr:MAG: hypothetical protein C6501_10465 [Candidatus Poribacteria bacterium]
MDNNLELKRIKAVEDENGTYCVKGLLNYDDKWVVLGKELKESDAIFKIHENLRKNLIVSRYILCEITEDGKHFHYDIDGDIYCGPQEFVSAEMDTPIEKGVFLILNTRLTCLFLKNFSER